MWLVLAVVALVAAVAGHSCVCHSGLSGNIVLKFLVVGVICGAALTVVLMLVNGLGMTTLAALLMYALGCELYIFVFTLVSSSVSASLLVRLRSSPAREDEIEERYSAKYMVNARIDKLVKNGLLVPESNGYALSPAGERLHRVFERLRTFFGHDAASRPSHSPLRLTRDSN
jgi:hypothetical protein